MQARWWFPKTKLLDSLENAIAQPELKALIESIKLSKKIYSPENDDWYTANTTRAALIKDNFYTYIDGSSKNEKVFFKMGANHLAKGINLSTRLYDIGNSVFEYAQQIKSNLCERPVCPTFRHREGKNCGQFGKP